MDLGLTDRVTLVTAATGGIGLATARRIADNGGSLVIGGRRTEAVEETASRLNREGVRVTPFAGDLTDPRHIADMVDLARQEYGRLDAVVSCVGSLPPGTFEELEDSDWKTSFDTKFMGTVRLLKTALPLLRAATSGRAVIIGGSLARSPAPLMTTSSIINSALDALSTTLCLEYAQDGVGFVTVHPGSTETGRLDDMRTWVADRIGTSKAQAAQRLEATIPTHRIATVDEVADLVAFLVSPRASHLTGTSVTIDGGQSVNTLLGGLR